MKILGKGVCLRLDREARKQVAVKKLYANTPNSLIGERQRRRAAERANAKKERSASKKVTRRNRK